MGLYDEMEQHMNTKTNSLVPSLNSRLSNHVLEEKGNDLVTMSILGNIDNICCSDSMAIHSEAHPKNKYVSFSSGNTHEVFL